MKARTQGNGVDAQRSESGSPPYRPSNAAETILALQRTVGNAAVTRMVRQRRLQRCGSVPCGCATCDVLEDEFDTKTRIASTHPFAPVMASAVMASAGIDGGRPLDAELREYFEPRLGVELGSVRLHDGPQASRSARELGARAYAVGKDVVLGESVDRWSASGQRLLAHELAHVAQQSRPASRTLARAEAGETPADAVGALASLTDTIRDYRERAVTALAGSGLREADVARIRQDIATCAAGEERLRGIVAAGDRTASAQVLGAFTPEGINAVLPRLTHVQPVTRVAVNEAPDDGLAAMPSAGPDFSRPAEAEAERIATALVPANRVVAPQHMSRRVLSRFLDGNQFRQATEAIRPAVPAITAGAAAGAAAAATAPLWVWIVVAVVVVAALVAVAYWVYSDDTTEAVRRPQPQPEPAPAPAPAPMPAPAPRTVPQDCVDKAAELSRGDCLFQAHVNAPSVRNPQADEYCREHTQSPCEYWLYSPRGGGALAKFDGVRGRDALECKCGYGHFLDDLDSDQPWRRRRAQQVLDNMIKELLSHLRYTQDCGLQYRVFVSSSRLAEWIRGQLGNQVDVIVAPSELCD